MKYFLWIALLITLFLIASCTTIEIENPVKEIKARVHFFMVDPQVQTFERVWSETDYLSMNGAKVKMSGEGAEIIKVLIDAGIIVAPP